MDRQPPARTSPSDDPTESRSPQPVARAGPPTDLETQVEELQSQFDVLRAQVRQAQQLSSLGTAAAIIAHEVHNLLTPILSYAKAALEAGDVELHKKALAVTVRNVQMLVTMSERVLEIGAAKPAQRESVSVLHAVDERKRQAAKRLNLI